MDWLKVFKHFVRVGMAGAIVAGIAAAFLVLNPAPEDEGGLQVNSSQADIAWMTPFARTHTQKFAGALEDMGHEPPRSYDLNGNDVYFSTRTTHKTPELLLQEYQQKLVEHGVNSRQWLQSTDQFSRLPESAAHRKRWQERSKASMHGEVLPMTVNDQYMAMTGMLMQAMPKDQEGKMVVAVEKIEAASERLEAAYETCGGDPAVLKQARRQPQVSERAEKLGKAIGKKTSCDGKGPKACSAWRARMKEAQIKMRAYTTAIEKQPELKGCQQFSSFDNVNAEAMAREFTERIRGFRSIEAFRNRESGQTVVTAAWSDDKFDMTSMLPEKYGLPEQDTNIPLCESCQKAWNFAGSGAESPYSTNQIWSDLSVSRASVDYIQTLSEDGWEYRDGNPVLRQVYKTMNMPHDDGQWMRFSRGNRHLTLHVRPDHKKGRTEITAFTAN